MQSIKTKLQSEYGVTILFAQLAFMVATVVSVVILSAAITSQKRVFNDRKEQQSHLTLSSAAELIKAELAQMTTNSKTTLIRDNNGNLKEDPQVEVTTTGSLQKEIKEAILYVNTYNSPFVGADHGCDFTMQVEGLDMPDVLVSMNMERIGEVEEPTTTYQAVFTFTIKDSQETVFLTTDATTHTDNNIVTNPNLTKTITSTQSFLWNSSRITSLGGQEESR